MICTYTGWPKKSKPPPIFQKIVLKIANEIRFFRKVKVWIKHYNNNPLVINILCVTYFCDVINNARPAK